MTAPTIGDRWLARDPLPTDPLPILESWQREAFDAAQQPNPLNPHAIALATVDPTGNPAVRMVLCKRIDTARAEVVFYTDRRSGKGRALAANPRAAGVFYWGSQNRQARVEGAVRILEAADADAYFASRPSDSQLGAWASEQSRPIASRQELELRVAAESGRFGVEAGDEPSPQVPRPPHWVGYAIQLDTVELWVSRAGRIHDRAVWRRLQHQGGGGPGWGPWSTTRLQP